MSVPIEIDGQTWMAKSFQATGLNEGDQFAITVDLVNDHGLTLTIDQDHPAIGAALASLFGLVRRKTL